MDHYGTGRTRVRVNVRVMARARIGVMVTISMSSEVSSMVEVIMPELWLGSSSVRVMVSSRLRVQILVRSVQGSPNLSRVRLWLGFRSGQKRARAGDLVSAGLEMGQTS